MLVLAAQIFVEVVFNARENLLLQSLVDATNFGAKYAGRLVFAAKSFHHVVNQRCKRKENKV